LVVIPKGSAVAFKSSSFAADGRHALALAVAVAAAIAIAFAVAVAVAF
jgi:hypothetical protein